MVPWPGPGAEASLLGPAFKGYMFENWVHAAVPTAYAATISLGVAGALRLLNHNLRVP